MCDRARPGWPPSLTGVSSAQAWPPPATSYSGERIPPKRRAGQTSILHQSQWVCKAALGSTTLFFKQKRATTTITKKPHKLTNNMHPNSRPSQGHRLSKRHDLSRCRHRAQSVISAMQLESDSFNPIWGGLGAGGGDGAGPSSSHFRGRFQSIADSCQPCPEY